MSVVLVYDVDVYEGVGSHEYPEGHVVFSVRSVRGAAAAFELVAEYYRRRRSPGHTPACRVELTPHRVDGESLHRFGNAVVIREGDAA